MVSGVPRIILLETDFKYLHVYCVKFIACHIALLNLKYLFVLILAFHMYAIGYEVNHHPTFLLTGLHSIACKCKMKDLSIFKRSYRPSRQGPLAINASRCCHWRVGLCACGTAWDANGKLFYCPVNLFFSSSALIWTVMLFTLLCILLLQDPHCLRLRVV
jgi:hypothetical protein